MKVAEKKLAMKSATRRKAAMTIDDFVEQVKQELNYYGPYDDINEAGRWEDSAVDEVVGRMSDSDAYDLIEEVVGIDKVMETFMDDIYENLNKKINLQDFVGADDED